MSDGGLRYVRTLFGPNVTRLEVPGSVGGVQRIVVGFASGQKIEVSSASVAGAWEKLRTIALGSPDFPTRGATAPEGAQVEKNSRDDPPSLSLSEPQGWRADREEIARLIDPDAWAPEDRRVRNGFGPGAPDRALERRDALSKADAILALSLPVLPVDGGISSVAESGGSSPLRATKSDGLRKSEGGAS